MNHMTNNRLLKESTLELTSFVNKILQQLFQQEELTANEILRVLVDHVFLIKDTFSTNEHQYMVTVSKLTDYLLAFLNGKKNLSEWCYLGEGLLYRSTEGEIQLEYYHCEPIEKCDVERFKRLCAQLERQDSSKDVHLNAFNVLTGSRYSIRTSKQIV